MRQVSIDAANAFVKGKKFKRGNTEVKLLPDLGSDTVTVQLVLFGNTIATRNLEYPMFEITTAGWKTVTTRDRLSALPRVSVTTKSGNLYLNDLPWDGKWVNPDHIVGHMFGVKAA